MAPLLMPTVLPISREHVKHSAAFGELFSLTESISKSSLRGSGAGGVSETNQLPKLPRELSKR